MVPREIEDYAKASFFLGGGGGVGMRVWGCGGLRCIMGDMQMAN